MGSNSSVSVELAQELMESIEYTIGLVGGVYAHRNIGEALVLGQEILESRLSLLFTSIRRQKPMYLSN